MDSIILLGKSKSGTSQLWLHGKEEVKKLNFFYFFTNIFKISSSQIGCCEKVVAGDDVSFYRALKKEQNKIMSRFSVLDSFVKSHSFFGEKRSAFFKSIKNKSRRALLIALTSIIALQPLSAMDQNIFERAKNLQNKFESNQIEYVQAVSEFQNLMKHIDMQVKKDIGDGNFSEAMYILDAYIDIAQQFRDFDLLRKLKDLRQTVERSHMNRFDLTKTGIYTDVNKSAIYFVGSIRPPKGSCVSDYAIIAFAKKQLGIYAKEHHITFPDTGFDFYNGRNVVINTKKTMFDKITSGKITYFVFAAEEILIHNRTNYSSYMTEQFIHDLPPIPWN